LKKENKALTQLKDSIEKTEFLNSNYLVNIEGVKLTNQNLIKGYYLIFDELLELSEVDSVLKNEYYINFENKFIKKIGDFYQVLGFLSVSVVNPYIYFGYQFNALPQLRSLDLKSNGWNANFGVGTEFKINPSLGIHYSLTYGFSFSDNIRHNFEHQFGVVVHPSKFYKRTIQPTLNYQKEKIITQTIDLGNLNLENDSLKKLLTMLDYKLVI